MLRLERQVQPRRHVICRAVIQRLRSNFLIHDDSSLLSEEMYKLHEHDLYEFVQLSTHWHRLAAYGMQIDLKYCVSIDAANVLPVFLNGELVAAQ